MDTELYMDTARLGRMCQTARRAELDFTKLVSQSGSSLYLERFLAGGFDALSVSQQQRFRRLSSWRGIETCNDELGQLLDQRSGLPSFYFAQSSAVIRFALEATVSPSSRLFITDLLWPSYRAVVERFAKARSARVACCNLRRIISQGASHDEVLDKLVRTYREANCQVALLSQVSYDGIRLPIAKLRRQLPSHHKLVVDGSQAIGQLPVSVQNLGSDVYIAGTQKWLGGFHPLRFAVIGTTTAAEKATEVIRHCQDPMARFCESLRTKVFHPLGETVSVLPLITASAAIHEHHKLGRERLFRRWNTRRANARRLLPYLDATPWQIRVTDKLDSGSMLLRPHQTIHDLAGLRERLFREGVIATTYSHGRIRLAMPAFHLSLQHITQIVRALHRARPERIVNKTRTDPSYSPSTNRDVNRPSERDTARTQ